MNSLQKFNFNGHDVIAFEHEDGTPLFSVQQVASALGYANTKNLTSMLGKSDEFRPGIDYFKITDSAAVQSVLASCGGLESTATNKARSITLLTRDCMRLAAMRADTKRAAEFRRWVLDVVFPAFENKPIPGYRDATDVRLTDLSEIWTVFGDLNAKRQVEIERLTEVVAEQGVMVRTLVELVRQTRVIPGPNESLPPVPPKYTTGRALASMYGVDEVGPINRAAAKLRALYDGVFGLRCHDARFARGVYAYSPSEAAEIVRFLALATPNPLGPVGEIFGK